MPTAVKCLQCGKCADACPTMAMEMSGKVWKMEDLMAEVDKDKDLMTDSKGGVTLCGGEPLFQPEYCLELLKELGKRGYHRAVDTTLYADPELIKEVAKNCELFLVDLKVMDSAKHKFYTGVPNELILSNIRLISELGANYWIRIPVINEVNADKENIEKSAEFLASLPKKPEILNILPYHDIGKGKHERMWTVYNPNHYPLSTPSAEDQQRIIQQFKDYGINAIIGG